ncbi:MAG: hypothetical protein Kow00127_13340 [Bacteroidales bacterium]
MPDNNLENRKKSLNSYARYSSIALQMMVIIVAGTWGGVKLDEWIKTGFPLFTVILSLASVALAIYSVTRDLMQNQNQDDKNEK